MMQPLFNYLKCVLSQHPTRNNFEYSHKGSLRENISDFTELHNEKKSIWKLHVNRIVSVTGTRMNVYQIS